MYFNMLNKDTKLSQENESEANFGFGRSLEYIHRIFKLLDAADVCWSGVGHKLCRTVVSFAPEVYHQLLDN